MHYKIKPPRLLIFSLGGVGAIKLNVSLSVCVALNRYIKIRNKVREWALSACRRSGARWRSHKDPPQKFLMIPNLHKFPSAEDHLVSYCVYDVGVSITATSVTLEHRHRHRCKRRVCTRTTIVFAEVAEPVAKSHTLLGLCDKCSTLMDRIIVQPSLGLRGPYAV